MGGFGGTAVSGWGSRNYFAPYAMTRFMLASVVWLSILIGGAVAGVYATWDRPAIVGVAVICAISTTQRYVARGVYQLFGVDDSK